MTVALLMIVGGTGLIPVAGSGGSSSTPLASAGTHLPAAATPRVVGAASTLKTEFANGTFYGVNDSVNPVAANQSDCGNVGNYSYNYGLFVENISYRSCASGAQNPSLLSLANGNVGLGYSVLSTTPPSSCAGAVNHTLGSVAFRVSSNDGTNFGSPVPIANATCAYLQSIEPDFTMGPRGSIDGVFVEENQNNFSNANLSMNYVNRSADALGFTISTNNGTSFLPVRTILAGSNIARPQIATFGNSIYVLYVGMNNSTTNPLPASSLSQGYYALPPTYPTTLKLIYSSNDGSTWSSPITLPGLNKAYNYSATSASLAINATGVLGVVYATNLSCAEFVYYSYSGSTYCNAYGYQLVSTTSATNGSSWTPLSVIAGSTEAGEVLCGQYTTGVMINFDCYASPFQWGPYVSFQWGTTNPSAMYVAWSGAYIYDSNGTIFVPTRPREGSTSNMTGANATTSIYYYGDAGIFSGVSTDAGGAWNTTAVVAPTPLGGMNDYYVSPALTYGNGKFYLTYGEQNNTYCYGLSCSPVTDAYSYWTATSANALVWNSPVLVTYSPGAYFYGMIGSWGGYNSAAIVDSSHLEVSSFGLPQAYQFSYYYIYKILGGVTYYNFFYNYSGSDNLTVDHQWDGVVHTVTYQETGLPTNQTWSVDLSGNVFGTNLTSISILDFPNNSGVLFSSPSITTGFWSERVPVSPSAGVYAYDVNTTVNVTFKSYFGIKFTYNPSDIYYADLSFYIGGTYYQYYHYQSGTYVSNYISPAFPWYFANNTSLSIAYPQLYTFDPVTLFTGTGVGSVNRTGSSATVHTDGPINETIWFGAFGIYNVTFVPTGLANGLGYSFSFDGRSYSGIAPNNVTVSNVYTGSYTISNIQANSTTTGWEYFGQASTGGLLTVPASPIVDLNFSYAYVDVGAPEGTVSFHAQQLRTGDLWQIGFNGSTVSSTTPWINLTAHPGVYQVAGYPVDASANDTVAYAPLNFGPTLSVSTGQTYNVSFALSYHVIAMGAFGGTISGPTNAWVVPGTTLHYTATTHTNYEFTGWQGTGIGSYTGTNATMNVTVGGPITETASFNALPANRFNLTFTETGIPNGTYWSVQVGSRGYSSDSSTMVVPNLYSCSAGASGQYALSVPDAYLNSSASSGTRWVPGTVPSTTCTSGFTVITIKFTIQYLVTVVAGNGGTAAMTINGVTTSQPTWVNGLASVSLQGIPSSGYAFSGWLGTGVGSFTGPNSLASVFPGSPVSEVATFSLIVIPPPPRYVIQLHDATPLLPGTSWAITWEGLRYTSTTPWINVTDLLSGTYSLTVSTALSPAGSTQYIPQFTQKSVSVSSNSTISITFTTRYQVLVQGTPGGSITSPVTSNAFVTAGTSLLLNATPAKGYLFVGWVGTGSSSYTGVSTNWTVTVTSPITEVATFAPVPPPATSSGFVSVVGSPAGIAGLSVAGLVVGLAVGLLIFRRRRTPPPAKSASPANSGSGSPPPNPPTGGKS